MNLFIIISIFIVCIIIIYIHVIKRGLHAQEKNKIYAFINQLSIPKMSEYKIVILRYDNYYFKSIDKLFETIEERHIVILTAPIWIYKRKTKCWPNQIVINSIDLEMNPNFFGEYEFICLELDNNKLHKNDNAYFSLICKNKEMKI
ncbi:hypothetical protein IKA_05495 [Bacillus cereus VD169]|uniref:hypothetical protein n=1 Tax=Bacillus cereus TaxID=1396 RepID=UPI000279BFFE|nr:hypothetical protein [Bacillus cereus]EJR81770.1 hypothetical protein IKA_05495 [Bacillus cereus VD169]